MNNEELQQLKTEAQEKGADGVNWSMDVGCMFILALIAKVESLAADAERWRFLMRVADDDEGPEAQSMESLASANEQMEVDRMASVQMIEMVDQARAAMAKEKA